MSSSLIEEGIVGPADDRRATSWLKARMRSSKGVVVRSRILEAAGVLVMTLIVASRGGEGEEEGRVVLVGAVSYCSAFAGVRLGDDSNLARTGGAKGDSVL